MRAALSQWTRRLSPAAVLVVAISLAFRRLDDSDTWWHLASGRWIVANGIPATDPFSHTVPDHEWINLQWLYDVLLYGLWQLGGANLLVLAAVAAYGGAIALLLGTLRRWVSPVVAAFLVLWAVVVMEERFLIRPEMVSFLLLALMLRLLLAADGNGKHRLFLLPFLMLLWVNTHSLFIIGFFCVTCVAVVALAADLAARATSGHVADSSRTKALVGWAVAAGIIGLANPYFLRGLLFPLELLTRIDGSNSVYQAIGEFRGPWSGYFETLTITAYQSLSVFSVVLVGFAVLCRATSRRQNKTRFEPGSLALFAALLYVSTLARRNTALFAMGGLPTVAMALAIVYAHLPIGWRPLCKRVESWLAPMFCLLCVVLSGWVATNGYYRWNGTTHAFGLGIFDANFPAHAATFAREAEIPPKLYNDLSAGGYLTWAEPVPGGVFVDGRLEVYDTEFFSLYRRGLEDPRTWYQTARELDVRSAIIFHRWPNRHALIYQLNRDPDWRLVHKDEVAVVFVRRDAARDWTRLIEDHARATLHRLSQRRAQSWQYPVEQALALRAYADLNLVLGDVDTALGLYDRVLDLDLSVAEEAEISYRYAYYLARRGDFNRARLMIERAREKAPDDVRLDRLLDSIGGG